jgi:hypothetical protein
MPPVDGNPGRAALDVAVGSRSAVGKRQSGSTDTCGRATKLTPAEVTPVVILGHKLPVPPHNAILSELRRTGTVRGQIARRCDSESALAQRTGPCSLKVGL